MAGGAALGRGRGLGAAAAVWGAGKGKLQRKERVAESARELGAVRDGRVAAERARAESSRVGRLGQLLQVKLEGSRAAAE